MAQELVEHVEQLKDCYEAVLVRRAERGVGSIRTRSGYTQLRTKYQARLRFLQDPTLLSAQAPQPSETSSSVEAAAPFNKNAGDQHVLVEPQTEEQRLRHLVGAYFDLRIKRLITDVCWPTAHFGGRDAPSGHIPEWQELEQDKYFAFMYKATLWLFPGLPGFEAQLQAEKDWQKDIEFDVYGTYGLSYEGFSVSLLDLATSCTDGSGDKCLEFLQLLTKRLQEALPIFRVPTSSNLLTPDDCSAIKPTREKIKWHEIPLDTLVPCSIQQKARYYELKTKLSTAPLVIMLLANSEKAIELQLSTSIKLLVRERESRTSVRRQTLGMRSHFIELEKQLLWTFRDVGSHPSVLLIPSEFISRRSMALYACIRLLDSYEMELHADAREAHRHPEQATRRLSQTPTIRLSDASAPALLTLYTSVQDPVALLNRAHESVCGRIDRNGSRLFVIDHRNQTSNFSITFKTSLIQNTSAGGGAGAAATLSTAITSSLFMCPPASPGAEAPAAHSYMFVVKCQEKMTEMMTSVYGNSAKTHDSKLAPQWFTTISGANEEKTVYITKPRSHNLNNDSACDVKVTSSALEELSTSGFYYVTVVSIHGIFYDAFWEDLPPGYEPTDEVEEADGNTTAVGADPVTSQHDNEQSSIETDDDLSGLQSSSDSMKSSANILRRLLLLRKKCQAAEPPPAFVPGANVFSNKTLTVAATLRAKFLRARALERHTRLVQHEDALRSKVLAKLLRSQAKFGSTRQNLFRSAGGSSTDRVALRGVDDGNLKAIELEARVNLLTHFFREMALHQPTYRELKLEESSLDAEGQQQDQLLDHFGDLFGNDADLQNLLDQEKWMSAEEKRKRRAALLEERLNLKVSAIETKEDPAKFCSEDYEATVGFIERLMREVEKEKDGEKPDTDAPFEGMKASWAYSNQRTRPPGLVHHEQQATLFNNLETQRREQWMQSKYIQSLAAQEYQTHQQNPLKSPLITSKQYLHEQTQDLPWQAVWQASDVQDPRVDPETAAATSTEDAAVANTPISQPARKTYDLTPRPPIERPKTAKASDQVASQSARFASANTRRIRSARTGYVRRQFAEPLHVDTESTGNTPNNSILHLPLAFIRHGDYEPERDSRDDETSAEEQASCASGADFHRMAAEKEFNAVPDVANASPQSAQVPICEEAPLLSTQSPDSRNLTDTQIPINQTGTKGKRRSSKKAMNSKQRTDKLFANRVQELVCIANVVKNYEQTCGEDAMACNR